MITELRELAKSLEFFNPHKKDIEIVVSRQMFQELNAEIRKQELSSDMTIPFVFTNGPTITFVECENNIPLEGKKRVPAYIESIKFL